MDIQAGKQKYNNTEYQREYNKTTKGKAVRRKYRHDNSKWVTDAVYLSKPIAAIDGEGLNRPDGSHDYVMLAISDAPSLQKRDSFGNHRGLTTKECFDYIFKYMNSTHINVIYGGSYDFNMWLKGLDRETLDRIYNNRSLNKGVEVAGYEVIWRRGKYFSLSKKQRIGDGFQVRKITIWDVVSFFQCRFLDACDQYLGPDFEGRDMIERNKAARGSFEESDLAEVDRYNQLELKLLVELVTELRARANKVHLRPKRWDGPGAFVSALFQREGIRDHMAALREDHEGRPGRMAPDGARAAMRSAYAGGRFEMIKYGKSKDKVYEYDINSAYPSALRNVPSLVGGEWIHHTGDIGDVPFAVYRVRSSVPRGDIPAPVFIRDRKGNIAYPRRAENWIWSPEMSMLRQYNQTVVGHTYEVLEVWEFKAAPGAPKPFSFINKLYAERQNLKATGDGAQMAIKLCLNSMYGKCLEQVSFSEAKGKYPARFPAYHQLEWGGYITSHCRATVMRAAMMDLEAVIAFETDAVFMTHALPQLSVGAGLGAWECVEFLSMTYVQSGHYYATAADGSEVIKCRGVDKGSITRAQVETALRRKQDNRYLDAELTRFYGAGVALMRTDDVWCTWRTEPKRLSLFPTGKRVHVPELCMTCMGTDGALRAGWHQTHCPVRAPERGYLVSCEFPILWANPNPEMSEVLDELRRQENEWPLD